MRKLYHIPAFMEERRRRPKKEFSILYVDDEAPNLRGFKTSFRRLYNVHTALNGIEALEILKKNEINIVVSDHRMPDMSGTELLAEVYQLNPDIRRMILSGFIKIDELKEAAKSFGVHNFVSKPWDFEKLKSIFENLVKPNPELMNFNE
ncbi:MAG: response regulator [Cyclobacteriaceae bacterium]